MFLDCTFWRIGGSRSVYLNRTRKPAVFVGVVALQQIWRTAIFCCYFCLKNNNGEILRYCYEVKSAVKGEIVCARFGRILRSDACHLGSSRSPRAHPIALTNLYFYKRVLLAHWNPNKENRVQTLAGVYLMCSRARHGTVAVPFSTWVVCKTLRVSMDRHPVQGRKQFSRRRFVLSALAWGPFLESLGSFLGPKPK